MSDKTAFQQNSSDANHPPQQDDAPSLTEAQSSIQPDFQPDFQPDSQPTSEPDSQPAVYGPAPKPLAQPPIFDRIYGAAIAASPPSLSQTGSPSFNLSAQRSASTPVNTVSSQPGSSQPENHGEQHHHPGDDWGQDNGSPENWGQGHQGQGHQGQGHGGHEAEGSQTISVESQCDGPSLNEIVELDISEASREELMVYHSELMGWIRELERALQDCQADFKAHLQQYGQQELLLEQRTEDLVALQARHATLNQEMEAQQKAQQRQSILVETLQAQLDCSQERVAQMERDFSQVQRRCSDQAQQLLQAEGLCRDLKSRLSRQQRHTMQFKAALEKSLAVSVNDSDYDLGDVEMDDLDSTGELFPRPKPVQPWSNPLDEAVLSKALNSLEQPGFLGQSPGLGQPGNLQQPGVMKGLNLQLAFENPDAADLKASQARAASKAQMAYGSATMGLMASPAIAAEHPVEPVFDPETAETLEAALKQESESILQGDLLGSSAEDGTEALESSPQAPRVTAPSVTAPSVTFVPPITPAWPEASPEQETPEGHELLHEGGAARSSAWQGNRPTNNANAEAIPAEATPAKATAVAEKKRTTLAGISLPSFPRA